MRLPDILLEKDAAPVLLYPGMHIMLQIGDTFFVDCTIIKGQGTVKGIEEGVIQLEEKKLVGGMS